MYDSEEIQVLADAYFRHGGGGVPQMQYSSRS